MITIDENHVYNENGFQYESVTAILAQEGFADVFNFMSDEMRQNKLDFGSYVHQALQLYDTSEIDMSLADQELYVYINLWKKFLKDYKPEFELVEEPGICKSLGYGYTIDRVANIKGKKILIDIKTGGFYKSYLLQLAGYKYAYDENHDEGIDSVFLVSLNPYKVYENLDVNIMHWFNLVNCWNMKKKYK